VVHGNYVGTDRNGTANLRNDLGGIYLGVVSNSAIGGAGSGAGNIIAFNGLSGVVVNQASFGNTISRNSIHTNDALGIDLGNDEDVTTNDYQDTDTGPNNLQNFPILAAGFTGPGFTVLRGNFNSTPNTAFTIDFYLSQAADPTGHGEGQTYLGTRTVITSANGDAKVTFRMFGSVPGGSIVSATATDPAGNTSEFGPSIVIGGSPVPGMHLPKDTVLSHATSAVPESNTPHCTQEHRPESPVNGASETDDPPSNGHGRRIDRVESDWLSTPVFDPLTLEL
jgi:hypothetical protein